MESELTTQSIGKLYTKYLVPSIGGALATSVYSFVDTIAVGQACGPEGAAAIAVINPYFALMCFAGMLFGIGGSVLMSHAKGEGLTERASSLFSLSLYLLVGTIIICWSLSAVFLDEILIFSGADSELLPYARAYIIPIVIAFPLFALNMFLAPMVRYDERPQLVLKAVLVGGRRLFQHLRRLVPCLSYGNGYDGSRTCDSNRSTDTDSNPPHTLHRKAFHSETDKRQEYYP